MDLPAIPRRTESPCQSRATNDRRSHLHTNRSGWQAHHRRECARANSSGHDTMVRWLGRECFKQPCRCPYRRRRRSARRPTAGRRAGAATSLAATSPAASAGDYARRCGRIDGKANGVVADAATGDGCRACAGRHHGEPGLQAGPHPRAARHATSAACHVGFSQNQAVSAARRVQRRRSRSAPPTFHREEARTRRAEAAHNPRRMRTSTPAGGASAPARRAGAAGYRHAGPARPQRAARNRNCGSGYFSSWRCRLRTNSVRPVRRSRLSRSALRIDCTSANASSTLWLTTI